MKIAEIRGNREKRKARLGAGRGPGPAPPGGPFEYETLRGTGLVWDWRCTFLASNGFRWFPGGAQIGPHSGPPRAPPGDPKVTKSQKRENNQNGVNLIKFNEI